jgi:nicotinamidase-related amidase
MALSAERLREIVHPDRTVVVTMELQKGIVADAGVVSMMPDVVRQVGLLPTAGRVCRAAREHGVRIVHQVMEQRSDGAGHAVNCRIFAVGEKIRLRDGHGPTDIGQPGIELVDELDVQPSDIKVTRMHGMTPFTGTELDAVVRNLGARTIVLMGVSLNLGIMGAALTALDLGYQVVVVRDGVVGIPIEYGEMVLEHTMANIATVVTADELIAAWQ